MGAESIKLFRLLEVTYVAPSGATALLSTDQPGDAMALRETVALPASTSSRRAQVFRLKGTTKGRLHSLKITSTARAELYGARLYLRKLGRTASDWAWVDLPVRPTSDEWSAVALPITPTSDEWTGVRLPIPPTSDEWSAVALPIAPTSDEWTGVRLPIPPTSDDLRVTSLGVDE